MSCFQRFLIAGASLVALAAGSACAQGAGPIAGATGPGCVADGPPQTGLPRETLTVHTRGGPVGLDVQVAADDETREIGLMFVRSMPPNVGMLFDFQTPRPVQFWMHNTYIPLDLIFVDAQGSILNIAARAPTCNDSPIPSRGEARAVIELNAGAAERLGIRPGDRVTGQRIYPAR